MILKTATIRLISTVTEKHSYVYTGDKLTQETVTTTTTEKGKTTTATETLYYAYDANGLPMSLEHTNSSGAKTTYYYAADIQGDVTAILDASGKAVVEYTYDAWGNPLTTSGSLASTVGKANSLRYREYVYDTETEFYYLQSRYYSPEMGRFINADSYATTGQGFIGNNMFAYCANNPVLYTDPKGKYFVIPLLSLGDYYAIHKMIQYDLVKKKGWSMEVYVKNESDIGFLDLYDSANSSYYEIKTVRAITSKRTDKQMKKYDNSIVADWRFPHASSSLSRGLDYVSGKFEYGSWDVSYYSVAPGKIAYKVNYNWERGGAYATQIVLALIATAAIAATGGAGAGVLIPVPV